MVDKLLALSRDRIRERIGTLDDEALPNLNRALTLLLGLDSA
jgi:mRNA-degrading endonuclease toxin of MazEF toxin-antitoxin module